MNPAQSICICDTGLVCLGTQIQREVKRTGVQEVSYCSLNRSAGGAAALRPDEAALKHSQPVTAIESKASET